MKKEHLRKSPRLENGLRTILFFSFLLFTNCLQAQLWQQRGIDLDGQAAGDSQGMSVSFSDDGKTLAMGCPYHDGSGTDAGAVRVLVWNGTSWQQKGLDIDGEAAGDRSGQSVSLSADGNTVAIGAPYNQGMGQYAGQARIYAWNGSSWQQKGLDIDAEGSSNYCGWAISLCDDGNTVAVASVISDTSRGELRVFEWSGSSWQQKGIDIFGEAINDYMGSSVTLSADGNTLAGGAVTNDGNGTDAGHTRVYSWNGSSWQQKGIDIDGEAAGNYAGSDVSLSSDGNTIAIGADRNNGNGTEAGQVRVYAWNGSAWQQKGIDLDGEAAYDSFGFSVEMSSDGNTFVGGSIYSDATSMDAGQTRVFEWNGSSWQQKGIDINGEAFMDDAGASVSISSSGNTIAIGAPYNDGNGAAAGQVRVYSCDRTSTTTVAACDNYTSPSGNYNWTSSGNYTDTLSSVLGCDSIMTINLTIHPSPTVSFNLVIDTVCSLDAAFTITGGSPAGGIFSGTAVTSNSFNPAMATAGYNLITYTYTDGNGCQGIRNDSVFVDACAGIISHDVENNLFTIIPNPSNGEFIISTTNVADEIVIVDLLGKELISIIPTATKVNVDLSNQSDGIYFVKVRSNNSQSITRLVLTK
jgi:hypothetical protein